MLYLLGKLFSHNFLRLFSSHLVLISIGSIVAGYLTWRLFPRLWARLPHDHGKALVKGGEVSRGKPTGAGLLISLIMLPVMLLVLPPDWSVAGVLACLMGIMYCGYKDDASDVAWGQLKKGLLDLACCVGASLFLCRCGNMVIWLPFTKEVFVVSPYWYTLIATAVLFISVNSTNCSDGVDGLAGSLGLISLLSLSALLYLVIGYKPVSEYLLIPHNPDSAKWAIMCMTFVGSLAGYLWYNAEPSKVLMGDAGSRMLGLMIGIAVLATGNPFLVFVVAPVLLLNGGSGLVKILLLRFLKKCGVDTTNTATLSPERAREQNVVVRKLHKYRFPLHDHFRRNMGWSNAQVLMRFVLIQSFLVPLLFALFVKVR